MARRKVVFAPYVVPETPQVALKRWDRDYLAYVRAKESVWKKPYLFNTHPESERRGDPGPEYFWGQPDEPNTPRRIPDDPGGGGPVVIKPPCTPSFSAVGGTWFECDCEEDCCVRVTLTCPDSIQQLDISYGDGGFQSDRGYNPTREIERTDDSVTFEKCGFGQGDSPKITADFNTSHGGGSKFDGSGQNVFLGQEDTGGSDWMNAGYAQYDNGSVELNLGSNDQQCNPCLGVLPTMHITYTSKAMGFGGTQIFGVPGGIPPFTWAVISGGGSFSGNIYTAPASNVSCADNPTIQVTDKCGRTATLKLSISNFSNGLAYRICCPDGLNKLIVDYDCAGALTSRLFGGDYYVVQKTCDPNCDGAYGCYGPVGACTIYGVGPGDLRTEAQLLAGCCPWQLIV